MSATTHGVVAVRPVRTEADYGAALAEIDGLLDAPAGSPDGDRLDVLVTLVQAYEARHHAITAPDPVDAIRFRMEQAGLRPRDLEPYIGGRGRVSEVLSGKRPLTLPMIRRLAAGLAIPVGVLVGDLRPQAARASAKATPKPSR